jgi:hypothetical protein
MLRKIIFSLTSLLSLVAAGYFSFFMDAPHYAMTAIWLTFCLLSFAIGWPEIAESISFLGSSIKLRDVRKAINELKALADVNSRVVLELIQAKGRFRSFSADYEWKMYDSIEKMLKGLGFKPEKIENIQSRWHKWVEHDYIFSLITNSIIHSEIPEENGKEWEAVREDIKNKINKVDDISIQPDELRKKFQNVNGYTKKVKTIINDLEYYKKHKKHRSLEQWKKRNNWF